MVDGAGGRSQLAQLFTSVMVLIVLLIATGPLAYLPTAALAAVVFLIAIELIDLPGLRRIFAVRKGEFAVALLTAVAVVALGVQDGIALAILASVIEHLRHSYRPLSSVLVKSPAGHWQACRSSPAPGPRTAWSSTGSGPACITPMPPGSSRTSRPWLPTATRWGGWSWTARPSATLTTLRLGVTLVAARLHQRHIRFVVTSMLQPVRNQLDAYGIKGATGPDAYYETSGEALKAYHAARRAASPGLIHADPPRVPDPGAA